VSDVSRRCLVLGGSGTLGRVVCATLAAQGARVGFTFHRSEAVARELASKLDGAAAERLDLTGMADVSRALDALASKLGGADALIHCAVVGSTTEKGSYEELEDLDEAGFDRLMAVNVKSAVFASRHFARMAGEGKPRNIVLLGSIDGTKSVPAPIPYACSKAALSGLAQSLAKAAGKQGICVNVVAPGLLEAGASRSVPESLRKEYLKHSAMKRLGRLEEVAEVIAWLALENTYVTGQTILVDGGL
jgi:NAD(P)-dependent dehydrogenase (short-subunit alcohol dehydrogenase family)